MSEATTPPQVEGTAAPAEPVVEDRTVPYDRFKQVNDKAGALAKEAAELRQRLEEREAAELSEAQRAVQRAEKAEGRLGELESQLRRSERSSWLRDAAAKHNFIDPAEAVAFATLDEVDSEGDAERAVKALAKSKPHLLRAENPTPELGKVLSPGQQQQVPGQQAAPVDEAAALAQMQAQAVMDAVKEAQGSTAR